MNEYLKVVFAILGGCGVIFDLFVPVAVAIMWILTFGSASVGSKIILILGLLTTLSRALNFIFLTEDKY